MGFNEGHIIFNNESLKYNAGEAINCMLVFDQEKEKTFRGMYAKLKGYCDVRWTTRHTRSVNGKTRHYTKEHTSHEVYIEDKKYLMGGDCGEVHLNPGHYEIPFNFSIPPHAPTSFEGTYGHIRYHVKVVIDRAFKFDQEKKHPISVTNLADLNKDPYCKEAMTFEFEDTYCSCCMSQGICEVKAKLPQSGYCPGQTINIEMSCSNNSNVKINSIILELKEYRDYIATHNSGTRHDKEVLSKMSKGPIPRNTTRNWMLEMDIPLTDLFNLTICNFIRIYHDFKIKVIPSGCHSGTDQSRRMILGHIPLREFEGPPLALSNPADDQSVSKPESQLDSDNAITEEKPSQFGVNSPHPEPSQSFSTSLPENHGQIGFVNINNASTDSSSPLLHNSSYAPTAPSFSDFDGV